MLDGSIHPFSNICPMPAVHHPGKLDGKMANSLAPLELMFTRCGASEQTKDLDV